MLPNYRGSIVRVSLRPIQTAMIVDDSSNIIHYNPLGQTEKELAIENYHVEFEHVQTA